MKDLTPERRLSELSVRIFMHVGALQGVWFSGRLPPLPVEMLGTMLKWGSEDYTYNLACILLRLGCW